MAICIITLNQEDRVWPALKGGTAKRSCAQRLVDCLGELQGMSPVCERYFHVINLNGHLFATPTQLNQASKKHLQGHPIIITIFVCSFASANTSRCFH